MNISDALSESKARFEAGEREQAGYGFTVTMVAPSYSRVAGGPYIRWDNDWSYTFSPEDMVADDWERNS